jgi:hypothetical protein
MRCERKTSYYNFGMDYYIVDITNLNVVYSSRRGHINKLRMKKENVS